MEDPTLRNRTKQQAKADTTVEVAAASGQPEHILEEYERLFGVDEEAYEQPTTTRKELWSYYLYYNGKLRPRPIASHDNDTEKLNPGDNGVGPGSYSQALYVCQSANAAKVPKRTNLLAIAFNGH